MTVGLVLLVLGLGALGWSGYEVFIKPRVDPQVAAATASEMRSRWEQAGPAASGEDDQAGVRPGPGEPVALVRIPAFGEGFEMPLLAGTDPETLTRGLGWYDGTSGPGEVGNFALAGLRGTNGPLTPIGDLGPGDRVVVETRDRVFTYELTNTPADTTVTDTDTWVIQPVPGRPEVRPTEALLTLTTTRDMFSSNARTVAFGTLVATLQK